MTYKGERRAMEDHKDTAGCFKWLIMVDSFLLQSLQSGVTYCVGVFYVMFRQNLGGSSSLISLVSALNTGIFFAIGPLSGAIVTRFDCRGVALVGSIMGTLGLTFTAFVTEPWHLVITFGIISGCGLGLCYIPSITIIGVYFGRRRSLAMGVAVTGLGMGPVIFPPLLRGLERYYGWRGAILIVAGLYFHSAILAILLRPRAKTQIPKSQLKTSQEAHMEKVPEKKPMSLKTKASTAMNCCFSACFSSFANVPLFIFFVQNIVFSFGLSIINVHIGAFAVSQGYSTDEAAMLFFYMSIGSALSRMLYGVLLQVTSIKAASLYAITTAVCGAFTMAYPFGTSFIALVALTSMIGVFYGAYGSLPPLITIDIVGVEQLASAYGYICVADGIGFFLGGPAAGWIYDATQNYPASFFLGGSFMICSSILMIMIIIYQHYNRPPKPTDTDTSYPL